MPPEIFWKWDGKGGGLREAASDRKGGPTRAFVEAGPCHAGDTPSICSGELMARRRYAGRGMRKGGPS